MKFGICNEIFENKSISESMRFVKEAGYDAIEIAPFTLAQYATEISAEERAAIRQDAADIGLEISGLHWVLVKTEGMHLTTADESIRKKTSDYFCELVKLCSDLGGKYIILGSPKQRNLSNGISEEIAYQFAKDTLVPSVKLAEELEITICIEPLAKEETNFINTAEEAIAFAKSFKSKAVSIILDVKAMCTEEKSICDIIKDSGSDFAYFHANDANLKAPGFGDTDFNPIADALKQVNYDGYVSIEAFKIDGSPEDTAIKGIDYLKNIFNSSESETVSKSNI